MASDKKCLESFLEKLTGLDLTYRPMMGEFLLYYRGKLIGGIYDNRLLIKPTKGALAYLTEVEFASPYPGAKDMILIENLDDTRWIQGLFDAV